MKEESKGKGGSHFFPDLSVDYGPAIVDHCCALAGLKSTAKVSDIDLSAQSPQLHGLIGALLEGDKLIQSQQDVWKGYIFTKTTPKTATTEALKLCESCLIIIFLFEVDLLCLLFQFNTTE